MRSTGIVLIFPKNILLSGSNGMRNIFLLLTQAAQFEFLTSRHFFAHSLYIYISINTTKPSINVGY